MKTNVLKSVVLFAALSIAFISCEKESIQMENELKKVKPEYILPKENQNDRELERDIIRELPVLQNTKPSPNTSAQKESNVNLLQNPETVR